MNEREYTHKPKYLGVTGSLNRITQMTSSAKNTITGSMMAPTYSGVLTVVIQSSVTNHIKAKSVWYLLSAQ